MNYQQKTIALWLTYMTGIIVNIITEFLPLFLGKSIIAPNPERMTVAQVSMNTVMFFSVPITIIILMIISDQKWVRMINLILSALLLFLSIYVLITDYNEVESKSPNYAPILMLSLMLILSAVNLWIAFKWLKNNNQQTNIS